MDSFPSSPARQHSSSSFQPSPQAPNAPATFAPPHVKSTIISQLEEPSFVRQQQANYVQEPTATFRQFTSQSREGSAAISDSTIAEANAVDITVTTVTPVTFVTIPDANNSPSTKATTEATMHPTNKVAKTTAAVKSTQQHNNGQVISATTVPVAPSTVPVA